MVRDFQSVIGREARAQCLAQLGRLPALGVACIGGGSNAMGLFHAFLGDAEVDLVGVEAAGAGLETDRHAATLTLGRPGVLHGSYSYLLQDDEGQVMEAHSISAGLDYPGVGPEHAFLKDTGRVRYTSATDAEALAAFERGDDALQAAQQLEGGQEGIIPAFESSHALAQVLRDAGRLPGPVLVCLSGRGDKDLEEYLLRRGATEERDAPRLYC